jgi:hypothetical protein
VAEVLPADARALAYGRSAGEVLENPQLRDKVRAVRRTAPATRQLAGDAAAPLYFERGGLVRMVHARDADYIAIIGLAQACASRRGLCLSASGEELLARLDEGGFSHNYAYGPGVVGGPSGAAAVLDSALRALERASDGNPFPRPPAP